MASATPDLRLPSQLQDIAGTKLYCVVTEARVCEQLAQGRYICQRRDHSG